MPPVQQAPNSLPLLPAPQDMPMVESSPPLHKSLDPSLMTPLNQFNFPDPSLPDPSQYLFSNFDFSTMSYTSPSFTSSVMATNFNIPDINQPAFSSSFTDNASSLIGITPGTSSLSSLIMHHSSVSLQAPVARVLLVMHHSSVSLQALISQMPTAWLYPE
jgi:hypothetical protein